MPFDFLNDPVSPDAASQSKDARRTNYHAGLSAEQSVARHYADRGAVLRETRWRGRCGEIDLILSEGDRIVFVEVKKSRTHAMAVQRVTARQLDRILRSAEDYLGQCPAGTLTDARLDVALVDAQGVIDIIPNASMGL
ncbi:MAG: YraN family protein [Marivita sp.]|uniref:YraN family protein n=1 Tax=Marivita sp. TaxID=2003365 RepID=UPI001B281F37|nr:YraN family protein [Marivita sp.]MBO6883783.1 YraN family protein [Marivita sp.]